MSHSLLMVARESDCIRHGEQFIRNFCRKTPLLLSVPPWLHCYVKLLRVVPELNRSNGSSGFLSFHSSVYRCSCWAVGSSLMKHRQQDGSGDISVNLATSLLMLSITLMSTCCLTGVTSRGCSRRRWWRVLSKEKQANAVSLILALALPTSTNSGFKNSRSS